MPQLSAVLGPLVPYACSTDTDEAWAELSICEASGPAAFAPGQRS